MYAVLIASSSAALVLPIIDSLRLDGDWLSTLLPQVAIADAACIVALPLVIQPSRAGHAALGALAVISCAVAVFVALAWLERHGYRRRAHHLSHSRRFAIELRVQITVLFALAAVAVETQVSIMLAGFAFGLAVSAVGEPRRLARQLFAITDGFLAPVFFVWLGASLDLRELGDHPSQIALGALLGIAAVVAHAVLRVSGQPLPVGVLAAAQLGVPIAAVTLGEQRDLLRPGESAALLLGALITDVASTLAGAYLARRGQVPGTAPAVTDP